MRKTRICPMCVIFFLINNGYLGGNERFAYIGLFDGYHGKTASNLCREHLHDAVLFEMAKFVKDMQSTDVEQTLINRLYSRMIDPSNSTHSSMEDIADVYRLAYSKMDYLLSRGMHETSGVRWSGTSTLTAVIVTNEHIDEMVVNLDNEIDETMPLVFGHIHVANCGQSHRMIALVPNDVIFPFVGNVEALGIRAGEAFLMSQKHTVANQRERTRVLEAGTSDD